MSTGARRPCFTLALLAPRAPGPQVRVPKVTERLSSLPMRDRLLLAATLSLLATPLGAQRPTLSVGTHAFVAIDTPVVALTHARVIDGTGAPARNDQTLIIRDGRIAQLGAFTSVAIPAGAQVMDLTGKSVIPGLVMVHEHFFYPTGPGVYGNVA